jgi:DNA invertase Pin-like site-specific DNA recombinase
MSPAFAFKINSSNDSFVNCGTFIRSGFMSVFLYARVSHQSSADSGISINNQIAAAISYASTNIPGVEFSPKNFRSSLPGVFIDNAVSGWSKSFTQRPAGRALTDELKAGDHIIFYSIDRMARRLRDFCNTTDEWEKRGVFVHYITDQINTATAIGKLQANIRAAMAQFVSDLISDRTREASLIRKMRGERKDAKKPKATWLPSKYKEEAQVEGDKLYRGGTIYRYERVSSDPQYRSGLGLEYQSRANFEHAIRLSEETGATIGRAFIDPAVSSFTKRFAERKAGKALLSVLQPGDHIVLYRLDRGWRNPVDCVETCESLRKRGIFVHMVNEGIRTDTQQGMEWISLMASMAHLESSLKSKRVKEALATCKAQGRATNHPRSGFTVERVGNTKKLVVSRKGAKRLAAVWLMRHELNLGTKQIEDVLVAWKCMADKRCDRVSLTHYQRFEVQKILQRAEYLKSKLNKDSWRSIVKAARRKVRRPIPPEFWHLATWQWPFNHSVVDETPKPPPAWLQRLARSSR